MNFPHVLIRIHLQSGSIFQPAMLDCRSVTGWKLQWKIHRHSWWNCNFQLSWILSKPLQNSEAHFSSRKFIPAPSSRGAVRKNPKGWWIFPPCNGTIWQALWRCWLPFIHLFLVGGFSPTQLNNMLVKLDHFPRDRGENKKYLKSPPTRWFKVTFLSPSWRSLKLWKGHLPIPKRSQRITP